MKYLKLFENFDESQNDEYYQEETNDVNSVVNRWCDKTDDSFFEEFIEAYPTRDSFHGSLVDLENEFSNFPGEDVCSDFLSDLEKTEW